ncbi:MAG: tetratricopeptide repeat protein [Deltaproteobacteria bacterium]|nr:tetratricopeptide repeat protein [Deltaproteobacteria bacterium]
MTDEGKNKIEVAGAEADQVKISGYFGETVKISLGTGATKRATTGENIYFAEELPSGEIRLSLLNMAGQPTSITEIVERDVFLQRCRPKPDFIPPNRNARLERIKEKADRHASQGNLHLRRKEYNSAEFEFQCTLKLDEDHVRANYGLAKLHLEKGEEEQAREILEKITHIDALFEEENKHVFNEFGIDLRRMQMFDQALDSYRKALEINDRDPVLLFNMARALIDKKEWSEAMTMLQKALTLKDDFPEAQLLLSKLSRKLESKVG